MVFLSFDINSDFEALKNEASIGIRDMIKFLDECMFKRKSHSKVYYRAMSYKLTRISHYDIFFHIMYKYCKISLSLNLTIAASSLLVASMTAFTRYRICMVTTTTSSVSLRSY